MAAEDLFRSGKKLFDANRDKIDAARRSEKAEGISDKILDGASDVAKHLLPDQHDAKIDELRRRADGHIGNE